ncbi:MAG: lutA 5 [Firmicutes bacterium]|nr:lutA 5 [Bacillota bacterium]
MSVDDWGNLIAKQCVGCGKCTSECNLLGEIGLSPAELVARGVTGEEAFSCALCGACESVCPLGLSPKNVFQAKRIAAVENSEYDIAQYQYLFPDREPNMMSCYREVYGIKYDDIVIPDNASTVFFPGCAMLTYAPALTRKVYAVLKESCDCEGILTECCAKPLKQMGLETNYIEMRAKLVDSIEKHKISKFIMACPGCYYELAELLKPRGISVQTIYEASEITGQLGPYVGVCTIHDACPDRFTGIFAYQVRNNLDQCGVSFIEMNHHQQNTICCGSGGQIGCLRPDLAEKQVKLRLEEAAEAGADILISYCMSCVIHFASEKTNIPVKHALNFLLRCDEDYGVTKEKIAKMFAGSEGTAIWNR